MDWRLVPALACLLLQSADVEEEDHEQCSNLMLPVWRVHLPDPHHLPHHVVWSSASAEEDHEQCSSWMLPP